MEPDDEQDRAERLQFLLDAGLVDGLNQRQIAKRAEKPEELPQYGGGSSSQSNLKIYTRVPTGSSLRLKISNAVSGSVHASAEMRISSNEEVIKFDSDDLIAGKEYRLASGSDYVVRFWMQFQQATELTLNAEVVKPDGSGHGTPWHTTFYGEPGTVRRSTLMVMMMR